MHARIVTIQFKPGQREAAIAVYRDHLLPVARQLPGFRGAHLLTHPKTEKGVSIVLWESEAAMKSAEANGFYQAQIARLGETMASAPVPAHYEVSVAE